MSTLQATNLKHNASASNNIVLDSSGNATFAGTAVPASSFLRNRIINGDMRIDQRNAGAAVTINTAAFTYTLDRWFAFGQASEGVFTIQRSTIAPTGFTNSLLATVTTADASLGGSQLYVIAQYIEGFNAADLGWGAAGAQTVTLSFWVRSSVTGTYGGCIRNGASNRSYPFSYGISAANTWEYKTITVAGDTTGTWATDNTSGPQIFFSLGTGSTLSGTSGVWAANNFVSATGATNLMATNGATFYLTGVQLEVGTAATPFERRQFGAELMLCQRYYYTIRATDSSLTNFAVGAGQSSSNCLDVVRFSPLMRASPTFSSSAANTFQIGGTAATSVFGDILAPGAASWGVTVSGVANAGAYRIVANSTTNAFIAFSAEL